MNKIQLPSYPQDLANHIEVRDYQDGEDFFRVRMMFNPVPVAGHFELKAQCFHMNEDGSFKQEPNGGPSRCSETPHTVPVDSMGDTIELDDAWVRYTGTVTSEMIMGMAKSNGRPVEPGSSYGNLMWDETADAGNGKCWVWAEGFADIVSRTKVEDMKRVLRTSNIHSGFGFKRSV